jgi:hypothetical protein
MARFGIETSIRLIEVQGTSSPLSLGRERVGVRVKAKEDGMATQERRSGKDRRAGVDRRKLNDPKYKGPERRCGQDRRAI